MVKSKLLPRNTMTKECQRVIYGESYMSDMTKLKLLLGSAMTKKRQRVFSMLFDSGKANLDNVVVENLTDTLEAGKDIYWTLEYDDLGQIIGYTPKSIQEVMIALCHQ